MFSHGFFLTDLGDLPVDSSHSWTIYGLGSLSYSPGEVQTLQPSIVCVLIESKSNSSSKSNAEYEQSLMISATDAVY